jgi:exonuclease III
MDSDNILIWNVCGLNSRTWCTVVVDMVEQEHIFLVYLQETKLSVMDKSIAISICGGGFEYSFVPAGGTRGGIMVTWRASAWSMPQEHASAHTLSLKLKHWLVSETWWITVVYSPQGELEKLMFLQELRAIRAAHVGLWMVCGDFNLIYKAEDKSNSCLNRRLMGAF